METVFNYVLQVLALQAGMTAVYFIFLHKSQSFQFNRYYLLASLTLPFVVPFVKIPVNNLPTIPMVIQNFSTASHEISLPDIPMTTDIATTVYDLDMVYPVGIGLYLLIVMVSIGIMIRGIKKIHGMAAGSSGVEQSGLGYEVHSIPMSMLSFSFINKIFISNRFCLSPSHRKSIIRHEEFHLKQFHSLDLVLAECIRSLFVVSPFMWIIQRKLSEVHEYLADRHAIKHCEEQEYIDLLRSYQWQETSMKWSNAYLGSSIKKRIEIMKNPVNMTAVNHYIAPILLVSAMIWLIACEENQDLATSPDQVEQNQFVYADIESEIIEYVRRLDDYPEDFIQVYVTNQREHPENIYFPHTQVVSPEYLKLIRQGDFKISSLPGVPKKLVFSREVTNEEMTKLFPETTPIAGFVILRITVSDRDKYMDYMNKTDHSDDEIYEDVDVLAQFDGVAGAYNRFIKSNLVWQPTTTLDPDFHDSLVISFVVNLGGGLVYINIEKEPETDDKELKYSMMKSAYDLVSKTHGLWIPGLRDGKYVFSKYGLPIEFTATTAAKF